MKLILTVLALMFLSPALRAKPSCCASGPEPVTAAPVSPRSIYQIDANWMSDTGVPLKLAELRGQPVVLTMFFARCEYACPLLVHDMRKLRDTLPEEVRNRVRFVLVTFDPVRDTPEALRTYREAQHLDEHWTLLRGASTDVQTLAMLLGVQYKQDVRGQFAHSNLITVLNDEGEVVHQRLGLNTDLVGTTEALVRMAKSSGVK